MKNLSIILLFFCVANVGCAKKEITTSKILGDTFQLKASESVNFTIIQIQLS